MGILRKIVQKLTRLEPLFLSVIDADRGKITIFLFYIFVISFIYGVIVFTSASFFSIVGVEAGQFGDFIGGVLNPILTFATFMGLIITIVLQQSELKDTREELSRSASALESQLKSVDRQNFEATFFQMLSLHNTIVNSIEVVYDISYNGNNEFGEEKVLRGRGRESFFLFYRQYKFYYGRSSGSDVDRMNLAYDVFWRKRQQDLSHYFRYLYNVLRFINEYDGYLDKNKYVRILRSQLSDYELVLLFYTALDENGENYKTYIDEYMLFDNLPEDLLIEPSHRTFYTDRSFGLRNSV